MEIKYITQDIRTAIDTIKGAILSSQLEAAKGVNARALSLYYGIGKYVSEHSRIGTWGTGALETISDQLRKELPGLKGFSSANISFMRRFYENWSSFFNSVATATEFTSNVLSEKIDANLLLPIKSVAMATDFRLDDFLALSFSHHMEIINKTNDVAERLFYIRYAVQNRLSKYRLRDCIKADLYRHKGALPNNFTKTLPSTDALRAIDMFKDEYLLDFINVEELGLRDASEVDEKVVEQAIIHNIKKFIMTFGHDFAFIGNQYHLEAYAEEFFPDLLFFNRELNAMVVVELKSGKFKPTYLAQLTTYLRILDDKVRKPHENPTIGIVLCREANKEFVQYVIQDYEKPMGVATYVTMDDMPDKLRKALPDIEQLRKLL